MNLRRIDGLHRILLCLALIMLPLLVCSDDALAAAGWRDVVQSVDPRLFYGAVAGLTWLLIWAWRRYLPNAWVAVTKKSPNLQQLPAFVLAGLIGAAPAIGAKSIWEVVQQVLISSFASGLGAMGIHTAMKEATFLPYQGGKPPAVVPPAS
jgi:hypothetical protein